MSSESQNREGPNSANKNGGDPYPHLLRRAQIENTSGTFSHPWNAKSEVTGAWLGRRAGLKRTGVSIVRIKPGKESFAYHLHHCEEEWLYILSGRGVATIDGREYELEAGDFVAFPTPSVAHQLANRSNAELVYLMGGENREYEIADFPTLDRRMVRLGEKIAIHTLSEGKPFDPLGAAATD